ncbi:calcineurin-like phosphoesterase family protein [Ignavibacteriales bacterium]
MGIDIKIILDEPQMTDRRNFIKSALGLSALMMVESFTSPLQKLIKPEKNKSNLVRKIRGRVMSEGKPVNGVVVSDGVSVVQTGKDGYYQFDSLVGQKFVYISNPAGYEIDTNSTGTARFYQRIEDSTSDLGMGFNLKPAGDDLQHSFLLLADPQVLDMDDVTLFNNETVPDVAEFAADKKNIFGVACGDIVFNDLKLFPEYEKSVKRMGIPFYQVVGNHDTDHSAKTNEKSVETFSGTFGPHYYSFNKGAVHYVVLNDVFWTGDYIGYLDQPQIDWLKKDLSFIEKGKTVIIFMHIPPYNTQHLRDNSGEPKKHVVVSNRKMLYDLLKPFKSYIITGHMHESEYIEEEGVEIHVCGAVCGAWWTAPTCFDGTPKGYGFYEVNGNDLKWKYKSTGRSLSHQMSLQKVGGEVMANVWGYDKYCKVNWYQDGKAMGQMEKRRGKDPETVNLFEGDKKPKKHTWVEPETTDHLFFAKPSPGAKMIVVEFVNRWGEKFTERFTL